MLEKQFIPDYTEGYHAKYGLDEYFFSARDIYREMLKNAEAKNNLCITIPWQEIQPLLDRDRIMMVKEMPD